MKRKQHPAESRAYRIHLVQFEEREITRGCMRKGSALVCTMLQKDDPSGEEGGEKVLIASAVFAAHWDMVGMSLKKSKSLDCSLHHLTTSWKRTAPQIQLSVHPLGVGYSLVQ